MEYTAIILSALSGALFRRWWGGWFSPNAILKRIIGFLLPLIVCFYVFGLSWLCLIIPSFILFGWLMPFHGYGIGMGSFPDHPLWACIVVMLAQYGLLTLAIGVVWHSLSPQSGGLYYAPSGCIVFVGYFIMSMIDVKNWGEYPIGNWFIDGYTCYGELILGAVLVGGIPLAHLFAA